ncbi:MAG: hypothetical protein BWY77_01780 [bacterium ADurb.Bin431]|nr:MAG: hypothetical protein BWY77_01780 [bacterium ADurb.Bin431]
MNRGTTRHIDLVQNDIPGIFYPFERRQQFVFHLFGDGGEIILFVRYFSFFKAAQSQHHRPGRKLGRAVGGEHVSEVNAVYREDFTRFLGGDEQLQRLECLSEGGAGEKEDLVFRRRRLQGNCRFSDDAQRALGLAVNAGYLGQR